LSSTHHIPSYCGFRNIVLKDPEAGQTDKMSISVVQVAKKYIFGCKYMYISQ